MQTKIPKQKEQHIPVLLSEVLFTLKPKNGDTYLDLTAGYGGHASAVFDHTNTYAHSVLVDRDIHAVHYCNQKFAGKNLQIIHSDFYTALQELVKKALKFDIILADLGVSSPHLNESNRGFSIAQNGPLDMRMDQSQSLSADDVVNNYKVEELVRILKVYGEEPKANKIAQLIVAHRPIHTTHDLARIVAQAWPGHSRVHPATRTFQALRIAVNDELHLLEMSLPLMVQLLAPEGRLGVISFHSLEDRIVKQYFKENSGGYDTELVGITKKPVVADSTELVINPRARSAKLRAVAKIKTKD